MYQSVTEEIPPEEHFPDPLDILRRTEAQKEPGNIGVDEEERDDLPEADHSPVVDSADPPGVRFSSSRSAEPPYRHDEPSGTASSNSATCSSQLGYRNRFYLRWEPQYLTTLPGLMKMLQLVVTVTALICATSISYHSNNYLSLPAAWKFRVFVFTSVLSLLSCVALIFCSATNIAHALPIDWLLLDIFLSIILGFLYFISSCMIASASASYNRTFDVVDWMSSNKLVAGVVLSYTCFVLYAVHALGIYYNFKRHRQFRHQLLRSDSGSLDSMQPEV